MNKLLIVCFAFIMSCTSTTAQKSDGMQTKGELLISESQGGTESSGFKIIKNEQEFQSILKSKQSVTLVEEGKEPEVKYPDFPKDKKLVLYNLGSFRSGDHRVAEVKSVSVKNNVLFVEVPQYEVGGMEIQMISNPWFVLSVPSNYQFNSVELKYSK